MQDPKPERGRRGRALEAGMPVGGCRRHVAIGDIRVAHVQGIQERVVRGQQGLIAAPVLGESEPAARHPGRLQVGVHIGAAERVDGLLRVADQHQRGLPVPERPAHYLPLDRIGVLKLVDEDDLVSAAQQLARGLATLRRDEGVPQAHQEVVVGQKILVEKPPGDLLACRFGEAPLAPRSAVAGLWLERGGRIVHGGPSDPVGYLPVERWRAGTQHPPREEVVDRLSDGVAGVLDQRGPDPDSP